MSLSQNVLFPICSWMKHSPTGTSASPPASEMILLHPISFGLFCNLSKWLEMTLMDMPVSYRASTSKLFTLTLYNITFAKFISSIVTSWIYLSSQSDPDSLSLNCMLPKSCLAYSKEQVDSWMVENVASLIDTLSFLAFCIVLSLHFWTMSDIFNLYLALSYVNLLQCLTLCSPLQ